MTIMKFHKWKKELLIADKIISIIAILLFLVVRPDYVLIAAYVLLIPYLILTKRKSFLYHLSVSSIIALIWIILGRNEYRYNQNFLVVSGINLFPLFSWTLGLFAVYLIYSHYEHILKEQGFAKQLFLFLAFYWPLLIVGETLAYHVFNIHNLQNAAYAGLPICNCMHAPTWMKIAYFALGPVFFIVCYLLKLENPHIKR